MNDFRKFIKGIVLRAETSDPSDNLAGSLWQNGTTNFIKSYIDGAVRQLITDTQVQLITNKKLQDSTTTVVDAADNTKTIAFDAGGTAGTSTTLAAAQTSNQVLSLPDATDTLVGRDTTDTLTNKSIDADDNIIANIANANIAAGAAIAYNKLDLANSIVNADINTAAAIAYSKLALTGSIVNADIALAAAIAYSKLALTNSIVNADIAAAAAIAYSKLNLSNSIVNADIAAGAAIVYSKLNLANSIVNADIAAGAAIAYSKLNLTASIVNADIAAAAAIARSKIASATPNYVVINDGSGNLSEEVTLAKVRGGSGQDNSGLTFPASGTLATLAGTETFTNKTFGDAITGTEIATPSNPAAGFNKLYFKSDGNLYKLDDTGLEQQVGAGAGGINYIAVGSGDATTGWATYADAAGAQPVDGTGGSPTVTWASSASAPLRGANSFLFTKDAANRQGEGVAYPFTIDSADQSKWLQVSMDWSPASGTFSAGSSSTDSDLTVYLYDVTNGVVIQPQGYKLEGSTNGSFYRYAGMFPASSNSTSYRLIFHVATTSASAYTVKVDNVIVSPSINAISNVIVADGASWTPTSTWNTNVTHVGKWRRVGRWMHGEVTITASGLPATGSLTLNLPTGHLIDTAFLSDSGADSNNLGEGRALDAATNGYPLQVVYATTSTLAISVLRSDATFTIVNNVSPTVPFTFGSGDKVNVKFAVPIVGWDPASSFALPIDGSVVGAIYQMVSPANTDVAAGATEILDFDTKVTDSHNGVTTGASWKFTAPTPGLYEVAACSGLLAMGAANAVRLIVFKNGSLYAVLGQVRNPTAASDTYAFGSAQVQMNAGDFIDIRMLNGDASTRTIITTTGHSTVSINKVSSNVSGSKLPASVKVTTPNGHGSTNTAIRRFSVIQNTLGTAIEYADSATLGGSFTIRETGLYSIHYSDYRTTAGSAIHGISVNSNQLTTSIDGITANHFVVETSNGGNSIMQLSSATVYLNSGDIVRAHTNAAMNSTDGKSVFIITKVS